MSEPDACSRYSHPAWGVVDIAEVPGPLPLEESQEPVWFTALSEEAQEQLWDRWWQDLVSWLSHEGATVIMVELTALDFEMASAGGFTRIDKWRWRADWKPSAAEALYRMNPEWAVVRSGARQLLSMVETWDGVTTEQDLRPPYLVDENPPEPIVQAADAGAKSARDNVRRGLKFVLAATAFIAYLILDPDWPFLVSAVVFSTVVPSLAGLAASIIYPKDDPGVPVPIDCGSDDGFAIYLEGEPAKGLQGSAEIFLITKGASFQSVRDAELKAGSPVFVRMEEGEARKILVEMVEFDIRARIGRDPDSVKGL